MAYPQLDVSYTPYRALGQEPSPQTTGAATAPPVVAPEGEPPDIRRPFALELVAPRRGFVAIPSYDLRAYVQSQFITAAIGFGFGVTIGAIVGDILRGRRVAPTTRILGNRRRHRRR